MTCRSSTSRSSGGWPEPASCYSLWCRPASYPVSCYSLWCCPAAHARSHSGRPSRCPRPRWCQGRCHAGCHSWCQSHAGCRHRPLLLRLPALLPLLFLLIRAPPLRPLPLVPTPLPRCLRPLLLTPTAGTWLPWLARAARLPSGTIGGHGGPVCQGLCQR